MKFAFLIEPPFNFRDETGTVIGCDVELARRVFSELGVDAFEPVETAFAELLPGLAAGRWRMTTGLFATEDRKEVAAFSRPIWLLPDGLLVAKGNPLALEGYRSIERNADCVLAVVRDQFQHRSAVEFGIPADQILVFETYGEAADAVQDGRAGTYASVARAHSGFVNRNPDLPLEVVTIPLSEKLPAFGSFAFAKDDDAFRLAVDDVLVRYLGSTAHREMMSAYGFSAPEIDLLVA